jgi:hypothetical protein
MRAPAARLLGVDVWVLGAALFGQSGTSDHVFGHDGQNYPAISHAIRVDPVTRSGIVILSSGKTEFAMRLAADWVYWRTGNGANGIDLTQLARTIAIGAGLIVVIFAAWVIGDARHGGDSAYCVLVRRIGRTTDTLGSQRPSAVLGPSSHGTTSDETLASCHVRPSSGTQHRSGPRR